MKRVYVKPVARVELFGANEYVAACYEIACMVGDGAYNPVTTSIWDVTESSGINHSKRGTAGTCADASVNIITTDDQTGELLKIEEINAQQGRLPVSIEDYYDLNESGIADGRDYYAWNTYGSSGRVWHHWGITEKTANRS